MRLLSDMSIDYPAQHPTWQAFTDAIQPEELLPPLPAMDERQFRYFISGAGVPAQYYGIKAKEATLDDFSIRGTL